MLIEVKDDCINDFRIEGTLSSTFLDQLKKEFGDSLRIIQEEDDLIDARDMDWYKDDLWTETPGDNLRFYRKLVGITQKDLADMLGMTKQHISDMERGKRSISKETAKELAYIFRVSPVRFL